MLLGAGAIAMVALSPSAAVASTPALTSVAQVDAAENQTCALLTNGTVRCWGDRSFGRLGNTSSETCGPNPCSTIPLVVEQAGDVLSNIVELSNGTRHTCALRSDATAWCWGENSNGDLGDRSTTNSQFAVQVRNETNTGPLTGIAHVFAGDFRTCAAMLDGTARCWGGHDGPNNSTEWLPAVVKDANGAPLTHVLQIESGRSASGPLCVLLDDHTARCAGFNQFGEVGNGTTQDSNGLVTVKNPTGTGPLTGIDDLTVSHQDMNVCARLHDGTAACWGINDYGQLGDGTTSGPQVCGGGALSTGCSDLPVVVQNSAGTGPLAGVVELRAGFDSVCARLTTGTVTCWGRNSVGQLGDGTTTNRSLPVAVRNGDNSAGLQSVVGIAIGGFHACARLGDGTATCWGSNLFGQLGDGTATTSPLPVVVGNGGLDVFPVPNAPTDVVATPGFELATVSWTAPIDNGASIISYRVTASPGGEWILVNAPETSGTFTDLLGGQTYSFTVHAVSQQGDSSDVTSNPVVVIGPPGAPTAAAAAPGNTTVAIAWTAPARVGSSPLSGYVVTPYVDNVAQPTQQFDTPSTNATISGLTNGHAFRFSVAAQNADGTGPDSDLSDAVAIGAPAMPDAPIAVLLGQGRARVTWTAPDSQGSPITEYDVVSFFGPGDPDTSIGFDASTTTREITGLQLGRTYTFTVLARNANGPGLPSPYSAPIAVVPLAPTAVQVVPGPADASQGSLVVSFAQLNEDWITLSGAACTSSNGGVLRFGFDFTGGGHTITVKHVTTGKRYTCVVRSSSTTGLGLPSLPTASVIVGAPAKPSAVHAARVGAGQLRITLSPGATNGSPITGYSVTCTSSNGGVTKTKAGAVPMTITGLTAGKQYTCAATATNKRGAGPQSNASAPVVA